MKNQTLSIEQMQHLQKIGVDTSNASMVLIATDNDGCTLDWEEALDYMKYGQSDVYFKLLDAKGAIYYFALYNKSLTPEEVEEEKVKLENYWEGGKNELA